MQLTDLGEFGLIRRIAESFGKDGPEGGLGIGDDCAVIPGGEESLLVTTDMLVEGSHFLRDRISAEDLGWKSLAVNLSDVAAMGGCPESCFLSLGLPKDLSVEWIDSFLRGFGDLADSYSVRLLGGDTTRASEGVVINVCVIGSAPPRQIKYRSGATAGDVVFLTGATGESGAGLHKVLHPEAPVSGGLLGRHNRPRPHVEEGLFLGRASGVHALMDVSDGIDSDLRHILRASGVSAEIRTDRMFLSSELRVSAEAAGLDALSLALTAGEDYCLLGTAAPEEWDALSLAFCREFGQPPTAVGEILAGSGELVYRNRRGRIVVPEGCGFDHFKMRASQGEEYR